MSETLTPSQNAQPSDDVSARIALWRAGAPDPELDALFKKPSPQPVASPFLSGPSNPVSQSAEATVQKTGTKVKISQFVPNFKETVTLLLVANFALLGALWYRFETTRQPEIATVGVTALTRLYANKVANDPNATPEVIRAKTEIFQDTVRKSVEDLSARKKVIILAREAVLTGEHEDLTPLLEEEVNKIATSQVNTQRKGGLDAALLPVQ